MYIMYCMTGIYSLHSLSTTKKCRDIGDKSIEQNEREAIIFQDRRARDRGTVFPRFTAAIQKWKWRTFRVTVLSALGLDPLSG